jgi:hypothetical protein
MRTVLVILGALWVTTAHVEAGAETLRSVIKRNGNEIGTSAMEINRNRAFTTVSATDPAVNLFFSLQQLNTAQSGDTATWMAAEPRRQNLRGATARVGHPRSRSAAYR